MTTTRKPAARKTAAAKKTTRTKATKPLVPQDPSVNVLYTEEQKQAKLEAYHALKSANCDIPTDLSTEVEGWIAELTAQREEESQRLANAQAAHEAQVAEANQNGPWYVRNGYPAAFNLRLDRQTEKRRIELKPRGVPGDLHPLKDEDLKDPVLRQNLALGLIEIIPAGEANMVIEKQTTNLGHRVHTPLAILRNELNQPYAEGAVKVEAEFNSQGITVATVDPGVNQGQVHDRQLKSGGGIQRVQPGQPTSQQVHSGFVPTGGNQAIIQYGPTGANAQAKIVDDLARRKDVQGPAAGLGQIQVVVDPVVRT